VYNHVSEGSALPQRGIRRPFATALAAALAFAVAVLGLIVPTAAVAAPMTANGVSLTVKYGGETYDGTTVVKPGTSYTAEIEYDLTKVTPGQIVRIGVPEGIELVDFALKDNEALASVVRDGDELVVTFGEKFTNNQGFYNFTFRFDEPTTGSSYENIEWRLDDQTSVDEVIVKDPKDEFASNIDNSLRKSVGNQNVGYYVSFKNGEVTLEDGITDATAAYSLTLNSADARTGAVISDTISEYLAYDQGSFTAQLTTWDEDGLNRSVADFDLSGLSFDGQTFQISGLDLPATSVLKINYTASVPADKVDALRDALQVQADQAIEENTGNGKQFNIELKNTATIDGTGETSGSIWLGGEVQADKRPNMGAAFGKSVDVQGDQVISLEEDGETLTKPIDVTYTLQADLTQFADFTDTSYALSHNVVINDFPEQLAIVLGDTITATVNGEARELTEAKDVSDADFFGDKYVDHYQWYKREDGTRGFRVNVGQDTTEKWILTVPGKIVSIEGARNEGVWDAKIAKKYQVANSADFYYNGAGGGFDHRYGQNYLVIPKDAGTEIEDDNAFNKTVGALPKMTPGEAYPVTYTFTLTESAIVDFGQSQILDHVNHDVFNVTDDTLAAIKESITGSYAWEQGLSGDDFDLSIADDGDLVFEASDSFGSKLTWAKPEGDLNKNLSISFTLMTHVVQGKQTIDVSNSASVVGGTKSGFEWVNDATGSATSYGNELEVQKHVYAGDGEWSQNLRVEIGDDGLPVQSEFVFRVSVLPHGSYADRAILDIVDILPEGTTFLGFVSDENLDNGTLNTSQTVDLDGNLQATIDDGKVTISQRAGTTLNGKSPWVNFKLRIDSYTDAEEFVANLGTTNKIGSAQATVTGSDGYPLQILKIDSDNPNTVITDRTARFTVTAPDGSVITDKAFVVDGQVMVEDPETGLATAIVIPETADHEVPAGTYTITEVEAPKGYAQPEEGITYTATIRANGSSTPVTIANDPVATYAIGDYTWIDANRDGLQGDDEDVLEGVTVELIRDGEVIETTKTDDKGFYLFDLLPAGDYKVKFTLTEEQAAKYTFTTNLVEGGDVALNSDADENGESGTISLNDENANLTKDYEGVKASQGIDPTWDAGVVLKKRVSVGDYVWFDENNDGIQDENEPGIEGVCLELVGPDGKPVVDVDGNEVKPTKTDKDGKYSFDNLPALPEGQHYTVKLSCAPDGYEPTKPGAGDHDKDSSTGSAESTDLTEDGQRDDTLDFGFVKKPVVEPTPDPTVEPTPTPTEEPTPDPTVEPTLTPTEEPTPNPTEEPTPDPTEEPTPTPTNEPSPEPTDVPTPEPTVEPVPTPTEDPKPTPTELPSPTPTADPEPQPTEYPSPAPTEDPQPKPTEDPAPAPTDEATPEPAPMPSENPAPAPTPAPSETPRGGLNPTGGDMALPLGALGATLLLGGVAVYAIRRRTQQ